MQARFRGKCADCTTSIEVGDEIVVKGSNGYRKIIAHRTHGSALTETLVSRACGDVADGIAHLVLGLSDGIFDGPDGGTIAQGLVEAAGNMLASFDPSFRESFGRSWAEYSSEYEYFDGEPWPTVNGLLDMLMTSAGRRLRADGSIVGTGLRTVAA